MSSKQKKYMYRVTGLNLEVEYTSDLNEAIILQNRLGGTLTEINHNKKVGNI